MAHGLWQSTSHDRYARFTFQSVCSIASAMVGVDSVYSPAAGEGAVEREVERGGTARGSADGGARAGDGDEGGDGGAGDGGDDEAASPLRRGGAAAQLATPPGWSSRSLDGGGIEYTPPSALEDVAPVHSLVQAWRVHNELARLAVDGPAPQRGAPGPRPRRRG